MIERRHEKQVKLAKRKGRTSADVFEEKDKALLQDPITKRLSKEALVIKKRKAEDGTIHSYEVELESGTTSFRNKKYMKHAFEKIAKKNLVRFADQHENNDLLTELERGIRHSEI